MNLNILAKVEDREITRQDMINIMRNLPEQQAQEVATVDGRKRLLDEMVAGELLYLDAKEHNFEEEEDFTKMIQEAKKGLLERYAIQRLLQNEVATDEEIKEHYEQHKKAYISSEEVKARHILINNEDEAKKVKEEIENGLDFSEAARKYSTCPSKQQGGDLGSFSKGRMVPEFEEAAFNLKIGELSEPIKTQFGYHLIMVDEILPSHEKTLEEVYEQLYQMITGEKQGKAYERKLKELKSKYHVELNLEALN